MQYSVSKTMLVITQAKLYTLYWKYFHKIATLYDWLHFCLKYLFLNKLMQGLWNKKY